MDDRPLLPSHQRGIFEGQQIELLKGDIVIMSPEGEPHAYLSDRHALSPWGQSDRLFSYITFYRKNPL